MLKKYLSQVVLATLNPNKVKEFKLLCKSYPISVKSGSDFIKDLPLENGQTFEENALLKAKYVAEKSRLPSLADDSGLCINSLGGFPGIYSARVAQDNGGYPNTINELGKKLVNLDKTAIFVCVLALYIPHIEKVEYFRANLEGTLTFPPKGTNGFGYDSIFIPKNYNQTFAEMPQELKNLLSHRFQAFKIFADKWLQKA